MYKRQGLPHPAVSGGARVSNGMSLAPDDRDRTNAAKKTAAAIGERQIPADRTDVSYGEAQDPSSEGVQVNISQQDYERPSASLPEKDEQKRPPQPAPVSGKKKAKKKIKKQYRVGRALLLTLLFLALSVCLAFFAIHTFEDLTAVTLFGGDNKMCIRDRCMLNTFPGGDPMSSVFLGHLMSAVIGLPSLMGETDFSASAIGCILVLGVFQLGLGYILFTKGLEQTQPVSASLISTIEPILNPILVAVFYGEKITPLAILGAVIVICAVVVYNVVKTNLAQKKPAV